MRISAIICEYNPMHNGHIFHINKTRELTNCDYLICLMSGNFTQRGEPSILDKFTRAEIAVQYGADIVLELPTPFAINNAEIFAKGAIRILNSVKQVTHLSFGNENADIGLLQKTADFFLNEPELFRSELKNQLKKGYSLNLAKNNAISAIGYKLAPTLPNNILGVEYLKALRLYNSPIIPVTISRKVNANADTSAEPCFCSSTKIREYWNEKAFGVVNKAVPPYTFDALKESALQDKTRFSDIILSTLRTTTKDELGSVFDVNEGIENSIIDKARKFTSLQMLTDELATKRYSQKRIRRIMLNSLFSITKQKMERFFEEKPYLRVLAINENSLDLLRILKENNVSVITRKADFNVIKDNQTLAIDRMASDIYAILRNSIAIEEMSGIIKVRTKDENK